MKATCLHPEALLEIREACAWYKERTPAVAKRFADNVRATVRTIARAPLQSPIIQDLNLEIHVRRALVPGFPYAVVFVIGKNSVIHVLAVAHQHRMLGYWLHRIR